MKPSEVYRKAAEMVAVENGYSCCAVDAACGGKNILAWSPATTEYRRLFGMFDDFLPIWLFTSEEDPQGLRVLALCFMAAIAEYEELAARRRPN